MVFLKDFFENVNFEKNQQKTKKQGGQGLSGRVLDSKPRGHGFEPHRRYCVVSLSKYINPSLVLVQPMKTGPFITERLLMGHKESNQAKKQAKLPSMQRVKKQMSMTWK